MPGVGLSENQLQILSSAIKDEKTISRYQAKIVDVPGNTCAWWTGGISSNGHGRFWIGQNMVTIAHRFGYALTHGIEALLTTELLAHRCDNPLCQRIHPNHLVAATYRQNRLDYTLRCDINAGPLADPRGSRARARFLRDLARQDPHLATEELERLAQRYGHQDPLFD